MWCFQIIGQGQWSWSLILGEERQASHIMFFLQVTQFKENHPKRPTDWLRSSRVWSWDLQSSERKGREELCDAELQRSAWASWRLSWRPVWTPVQIQKARENSFWGIVNVEGTLEQGIIQASAGRLEKAHDCPWHSAKDPEGPCFCSTAVLDFSSKT